ncbi:Sugar transporter [Jatrophihabitans endophyticus]|uniref:Sugar transporter n=1 Tax=Jatrophihabitans endophyticus TaxID=1206085 RepID=A0A1M5DXU1_9ACTN|nr:MFS transporter [Jatrophihabitans endophyticus]SHF71789.1 Sugar transporter [Jatrophihabitans endophyticus]
MSDTITTDVPARLDRLPWSRWHWTVVIGLGTVWILDGLEVTIVGNLAPRLAEASAGLGITEAQVTGLAAALYVAGSCTGALLFGYLTDRFGRRKLFMITLAVYLAATAMTAVAFAPWWFFVFRFVTGLGIGGEYAAINSAVDELIPSSHRGRVDLAINGTYWLGAVGGALLSIVALNTNFLPADVGWRVSFALGVVLGLVILLVRRNVPESPRWLFIHGRDDEARRLVDEVERTVRDETGQGLSTVHDTIEIEQRETIGFLTIAKTVLTTYPKRTVLGLSLFIGQAFLYNAVTFGYASILTTFFDVDAAHTGYFYAVIAVGNFLGPVALGTLFDTLGRKPMIAGTYLASGILLFVTAWLFSQGVLSAVTMTICWTVVLFFASTGASSAYLTVSEIFPMETRAMAIAFFYAIGTALGGITGPLLFADLTSSGVVGDTVLAFCVGAAVMTAGGIVAIFFAVDAAGKGLESIAAPLTSRTKAGSAAAASA